MTKTTHDHHGRRADRRQPEQPVRRPARPAAAAGLPADREARAPEPRAHPGARGACQGLGRLWHADHHQRHHAIYQGQGLLRDRQADGSVPALLDRRRRARRGGCRARRARLRAEVLYGRGQLGPRRQQHAGVLRARPGQVPRLHPHAEAPSRPPTCARRPPCGISGRSAPRACTRSRSCSRIAACRRATASCTASARTPTRSSTRRASASGSSSTSRPCRASRPGPTARREAVVAKDRESAQRDLYEAIEGGEFPRWKFCVQIMPETDAEKTSYNPFDLTKVWPHADYPLIEVGILELNRNAAALLRRDRAGRVLAVEHRARHRLLAGQDAAGAASSPMRMRIATASARITRRCR